MVGDRDGNWMRIRLLDLKGIQFPGHGKALATGNMPVGAEVFRATHNVTFHNAFLLLKIFLERING